MGITNDQAYQLDRMNPEAFKASLGTAMQSAQLYAYVYTTTGGAAAEDVTISGVVATDVVLVTLKDAGTNVVTVASAEAASGKITVTFSGDPGNDAIVNILVVRPI